MPSDKQLKFLPQPVKLKLILTSENNFTEFLTGKLVFITFVIFVTLEAAPPVNQIDSYFWVKFYFLNLKANSRS